MAQIHTPEPHAAPEPSFGERFTDAMENPRLATSLTNFQTSWRADRSRVMEDIDFIDLRALMKEAKTDAIDNLDAYLDQFAKAAEAAGTHIHYAADADEATRIIGEIAVKHDVKLVAKSKSNGSSSSATSDPATW
jgi:L-lactate dehydrogenase complex protein LldF